MTTNINVAFRNFLANTVNLDPTDTADARQDRENLKTRIARIASDVSTFPTLYPYRHVNFGSFARRTKTRPLDDVDMMFCIDGADGAYDSSAGNDGVDIHIYSNASKLYRFTNDDNITLNSVKILNKFKNELKNIYQYRSADINTRQEAVKLSLTSRDWSFDIVPCFYTDTDYYLIPDGKGKWKKTDPRIDQSRVSEINQANSGNVLNVIRIIKYWNSRPTMPTIPSYLLEVIILDHYKYKTSASEFIDLEIPSVLHHIKNNIFNYIEDPKGFQGDLNTLSFDEKYKIYNRAGEDYDRAVEARRLENSDMPGCFRFWRKIFGDAFPEYG